MELYPTRHATLDDWSSEPPTPGLYQVTKKLTDALDAHANVAVRADAHRMVVFLPGAQGANSQRRVPYFHRWTWHEDLDDVHVVALGDPAIALDERMRGGWFMHPELDLIVELASIVERIAHTLGVQPANITFHGSSLGGFGAIGLAAHLPGSAAIAEIPQIDVERWPVPSAIRLLEELIGQPLAEFRTKFPERVDALARVRYAKVVPPLLLITNESDASYDLQVEFIDALSTLSSECEVLVDQALLVTETVSGHVPLPKDEILDLIRSSLPTT